VLDIPMPPAGEEPVLKLSQEALEAFTEYRERLEVAMRPSGELIDMRDWGAKAPGHVLRIAAALHLWTAARRWKSGSQFPSDVPIGVTTITNAITLGEHYAQHAAVAYSMMVHGEGELGRSLLQKVIGWGVSKFSTRDIWQRVRRTLGDLEQLGSILRTLEGLGYIRRAAADGGVGRPSEQWEVNPKASFESVTPYTKYTKPSDGGLSGSFVDSVYAARSSKSKSHGSGDDGEEAEWKL
ncbi:MAG: DUF3987 domain-containing protein, partial [Chloroflexota bacterium]